MANKELKDVRLFVDFLQAENRENIVSNENISTSFGKIAKVIADLEDGKFSNSAKINDVEVTGDLDSATNLNVAGKIVAGTEYTVDGTTYTADEGAEVFNDYDNNIALGYRSHAEGLLTLALGAMSHVEGYMCKGTNISVHAEGSSTTASGHTSHAEGSSTTASGHASHAEGGGTTASGQASHAEGSSATASGEASHAEGQNTIASGVGSHSGGLKTTASGAQAYAIGISNNIQSDIITISDDTTNDEIITAWQAEWSGERFSLAKGMASHVEGVDNLALGDYSHAEGQNTIAFNTGTHSEGYGADAHGEYSHAEGISTVASGRGSHSEGFGTIASGGNSHAEGYITTASGGNSHAEGHRTTASGAYSHAEGYTTTASGAYSHASGNYTIAAKDGQTAIGWYNIEDTDESSQRGKYAFIIGNGNADGGGDRSNAFAITWAGEIESATGKVLSTNDFTDALKSKLEGVAEGATAIVVDNVLSTTSPNAIQNRIVADALSTKVDMVDGMGLSEANFTNEEKTKLASITNPMIIKGTVASATELPTTAEIGWIYFVGADGSSEYDEYVYTENSTWEVIGHTTIDMSGYVQTTDIATTTSVGLVKPDGVTLTANTDGVLSAVVGTEAEIDAMFADTDWEY